jgi:hypothetical protein
MSWISPERRPEPRIRDHPHAASVDAVVHDADAAGRNAKPIPEGGGDVLRHGNVPIHADVHEAPHQPSAPRGGLEVEMLGRDDRRHACEPRGEDADVARSSPGPVDVHHGRPEVPEHAGKRQERGEPARPPGSRDDVNGDIQAPRLADEAGERRVVVDDEHGTPPAGIQATEECEGDTLGATGRARVGVVDHRPAPGDLHDRRATRTDTIRSALIRPGSDPAGGGGAHRREPCSSRR